MQAAVVEDREVREGTDVEIGVRIGKGAIVGNLVCTLQGLRRPSDLRMTDGEWM